MATVIEVRQGREQGGATAIAEAWSLHVVSATARLYLLALASCDGRVDAADRLVYDVLDATEIKLAQGWLKGNGIIVDDGPRLVLPAVDREAV